MTRLGVLGGTFDPFHNGHLAAARAAIECGRLDRVLVIPAATPPHRGVPQAAAPDRLEMARLGTRGVAGVEVLDLELRRPGRSYTLDTLRELGRAHAGAELFLVLGWDAAKLFRTWHRYREVRALAGVVLFPRLPEAPPGEADLRAAGLDPARTIVCQASTPDVNATELRERAARGESLAGLVPAAVAEYVAARGLYRG